MNRDTRIELLTSARDGLLIEGVAIVVVFLFLAIVVNGSGILGILR